MKLIFQADDVRIGAGKDAGGKPVPVLSSAKNGSILVEVGKAEIESAILSFAQAMAAEQGAKVESAELTLSSSGERAVAGSVRVKAKKGFIPAIVTVTGRAEVDERLNVTVASLTCAGEGLVGQMVGALLSAKLREFEGHLYPLAGEHLKNVRLKEIKVDAVDPLRISATFES